MKHGITLGDGVDLAQAATRLLELKHLLDGKQGRASTPQRAASLKGDSASIASTPVKAQEADSPQAIFEEGEAQYLKGDFEAAHARFLRAAEGDHRLAQVALGYLHWHGKGCEKSKAKAFTWFKYAADRHDANAMLLLAGMHQEREIDQGDDRDERAQQIRLLTMAAELGLATAQVRLGVRYLQGHGVNQDFGAAMKWYRRAADRGSSSAMGNIAKLYEKGLGVPVDPVKAAMWDRMDKDQLLKDKATPAKLPWNEEPLSVSATERMK